MSSITRMPLSFISSMPAIGEKLAASATFQVNHLAKVVSTFAMNLFRLIAQGTQFVGQVATQNIKALSPILSEAWAGISSFATSNPLVLPVGFGTLIIGTIASYYLFDRK